MKLVIDGIAGVGTVEMGGYDYHVGNPALRVLIYSQVVLNRF